MARPHVSRNVHRIGEKLMAPINTVNGHARRRAGDNDKINPLKSRTSGQEKETHGTEGQGETARQSAIWKMWARWLTLIYLGQSETSLWSIKPFSKHRRRTKVRRRREINWYISHSARRARTPRSHCASSSIKMLRILLFNFIAYTRETISKLFRIFCDEGRRGRGRE